jgi:uncharacterized protein with ParB-like and HNH nuclease domain
MSFQMPKTVREVVTNIHTKKYLLPAIQREVVWNVDQITRLFDSLMRDYPIGTFLFWHVSKENVHKYQFYEFLREYHEKDCRHNTKADVTGEDDITAILDGQQRLTSLYIGLRGSYAYKEPKKRWDNPQAFPKRYLYLNLLSPTGNEDETDMLYNFEFLTEEEVEDLNKAGYWFKVGEILNLKEQWQVNDYLLQHELMQKPKEQCLFANRTIFKLWSVVHEAKIINYFEEEDQTLDKVLNIFIRVNSGGTVLSYSDLLLSIASAQWKNRDAREEIISLVEYLNHIGDGFNFDKDLVLKSSLVLSGITDIAFKVDNFNKTNMSKIEKEWDDITGALRAAVQLVWGFGYNRETLTANYAIIPIANYLKKIGLPMSFDIARRYASERDVIRQWVILSLVKRVFGGQPDTVLRPIRDIINKSKDVFPLQEIIDKFKGTPKSLIFTDDDVENLLHYEYGQGYTFSILSLLYPSLDFRNKFNIDHIHPRSLFTKSKLRRRGIQEEDIEYYLENVDQMPNLQLLEGIPNQEKSNTDFEHWLKSTFRLPEQRQEYMKKHFIPDVDLSLANFREFFEKRKSLMKKELKRILHASNNYEKQ